MCGSRIPKQRFTAMAGGSTLHTIVLRCMISMTLNIGKNITGLEMMTSMNGMFPNLQNYSTSICSFKSKGFGKEG